MIIATFILSVVSLVILGAYLAERSALRAERWTRRMACEGRDAETRRADHNHRIAEAAQSRVNELEAWIAKMPKGGAE